MPFYYRNFGVWWWHVKAELKRNGYDREQLFHLGPYIDPSVLPYYEGKSTVQLDTAAYNYQWAHTFAEYNSNRTMTPNGEVYMIHDQDVE